MLAGVVALILLLVGVGITYLDAERKKLRALLSVEMEQRAYWQARAERYIDLAATRTGVSHEPVMQPKRESPVALSPFAGMGMSEFDSKS